jgi:hypothetical protein
MPLGREHGAFAVDVEVGLPARRQDDLPPLERERGEELQQAGAILGEVFQVRLLGAAA